MIYEKFTKKFENFTMTEESRLILNLPTKKVMKALEVGQQNGMSPQRLYQDILDVYLKSDRYKELQVSGFLKTNLEKIDHVLDYLKDK